MGEKKTIQIILVILLIIISFFIFNSFYDTEKSLKLSKTSDTKDVMLNNINDGKNLIKDIKYTSNNNNGDIFEILAEYGEPNINNAELVFLTNVTANIIFINGSNIKLVSDYANLNTQTFETTFIENIKILRDDEIVLGKELYLIFDQTEEVLKENPNADQNLIRISYDVIVKKPGYTLKADVLEIDLITKNLKVFMNKDKKKVQIISELNK